MNFEGFEMYLRQQGLCNRHEIKEKISRISWVETTLNISMDYLAGDEEALKRFKDELMKVIGSEEKTDDFYQALWTYYTFIQGMSDQTGNKMSPTPVVETVEK